MTHLRLRPLSSAGPRAVRAYFWPVWSSRPPLIPDSRWTICSHIPGGQSTSSAQRQTPSFSIPALVSHVFSCALRVCETGSWSTEVVIVLVIAARQSALSGGRPCPGVSAPLQACTCGHFYLKAVTWL